MSVYTVLIVLVFSPCVIASPGASEAGKLLREGLDAACPEAPAGADEMAARISGSKVILEESLEMRGTVVGWQRHFELPDGAEIRITRLAPGGALRRLEAEYWTVDPAGKNRPRVAAVAGPGCGIQAARRLVYQADSPQPVAIEHLDRGLARTGRREPLNPPVPPGNDTEGVPVALVDAGVNYLLPDIHQRLARDDAGEILGYDYWDLDARPFDANPARSPFFPQRHGTRTASLLLREAPGARLVPYRYPRPDMHRMIELVRDAASKGIVVFNLSMGSNEPSDWEAFAEAARTHPDMLFVLSAGNNGRDLDSYPVYPAALNLDNTMTVTSSDRSGEPAPGSNWGSESVDLLVPAERLVVTGFDGNETIVSGSSYAAVRVSALAARFLTAFPDWRAAELKEAIFARALPASFTRSDQMVARGFIPRPDKAEHLPAISSDGRPREIARHTLHADELYTSDNRASAGAHILTPTLVRFEDSGWTRDTLRRHAGRMAAILAQCDIFIPRMDVRVLEGPVVYRYFHDAIARDLVRQVPLSKPTLYFVRDTLQVDAYDAEAIGKSNSTTRPQLRDTIWITEGTSHPGIALAHELAHVLMDSGRHVEAPNNLMRAETAAANTGLTMEQCETLVVKGRTNGLLTETY